MSLVVLAAARSVDLLVLDLFFIASGESFFLLFLLLLEVVKIPCQFHIPDVCQLLLRHFVLDDLQKP